MRKPSFCRLFLEELESRHMLNLILGQLGTPGSALLNSNPPDLEAPSIMTAQNLNQVMPESWVSTDAANSKPDVGMLLVAGDVQSVSPTTTNSSPNQQASASTVADMGSDGPWQNSFDIGLPGGNNASVVLGGAGDSGLPLNAGMSASAAALSNGSNSSSAIAAASAGFVSSSPGSLALATRSQSAPMMLFPSADIAAPLPAGPQKPSTGSPPISPTFGSGPQVPTGFVDLSLPSFIPVNADDDNRSAVTNGIPAIRDFNFSPLPVNDPELLPGNLTGVGLPAGGTWTITMTNWGLGRITLWTDQKKMTLFFPSGQGSFPFYVEGTHESSSLNDIGVTATYQAPSGQTWGLSVTTTVTPLINSFGVATSPSPNVSFTVGGDGSSGLKAVNNFGVKSAQFKGVLDVHALKATDLAQFIQNVTGGNNGENGTKDKNANSVGWLYNDMTGWVLKPLQQGSPGYPLLDVLPTATTQTLRNPSPYTVANGIGTVTDWDAPQTGTPQSKQGPPGNTGIAVDYHEFFQLFLVWQYNNNGPDSKTTIYYPIALTTWSVTFYAFAPANNNKPPPLPPPYGNSPISYIQIPNGVSSAGPNSYNATNQVPDQMVVSPATIADGNIGWTKA